MKRPVILIVLVAAALDLPGGLVHAETSLTAAERLDLLIETQLTEKQVAPNPPIDDSTFLRRIHLDLVGRIPTLEEADAFLADSSPDRRGRLIDGLLASEGYVSHFYHFWADILRISARLGINETPPPVEHAYRLWLKQALRENKPYDVFVRELLTAQGHFWENGAVGYYQRDRGMPLDNLATTARIFLGTRLECAQCHNHPFDKWTQMDFYHMAAFSYGMESKGHSHPNRDALRAHLEKGAAAAYQDAAGVKDFPVFKNADVAAVHLRQLEKEDSPRLAEWGLTKEDFMTTAKRAIAARETIEKTAQRIRAGEDNLHIRVRYVTTREYERELRLPHDYLYKDAKPFDPVAARAISGPEATTMTAGDSKIHAFAAWLTSRENPTFTRVIVNRLWNKVFGLGLFEPLDDLNVSTPIVNPALMKCLEDLMRDLNYDQRAFLSVLCRTRAYQRAVTREEREPGEPYYFPGPVLRRMTAEQIWDSVVAQVVPESDYFRPQLKRQLEGIERVRSIYDSLASLSEQEYIANLVTFGEVGGRIGEQLSQARQARSAARLEGNAKRLRENEAEEKALNNQLAAEIVRLQKVRQKEIPATELLAHIGMLETPLPADGSPMRASAKGVPVMTEPPRPQFPKPPKDLSANGLAAWRERTRTEFLAFVKALPDWPRASELDSPAPRGHFLRDFGQSDRETVENASIDASVTQALTMLNGPAAQTLTNRFTVLGRRVELVTSPEERAALIFRALFTRSPTDAEMTRLRLEIEQAGEEQARESLIWALLNTRRFIFIE